MLGLERIGVQSRFILLMLLVSLGSILAIGWIGYQSAQSAITNAVQNHLQSVRYSKTSGLKALLESLRDQVIALSDGKLAAEAMINFRQSYRELAEDTLTADQEEALRSYYTDHFLPQLQKNLGGTPQLEQYLPAEPAQRYLQYHYIAAPTLEGLAVGDQTGTDKADTDQTGTDKAATEQETPSLSPVASSEDDSLYGLAHAAMHERFDRLAKMFGYEDILLIDDDTLEFVY
jgi:hypothetical protein